MILTWSKICALADMTRRDGQGDDPAIVMPTGLEFNPIQDGLFRGCSRIGGGIHHTYPTMMKLGTVIPLKRKVYKIYKSRDTFLEFC